MRPAIIRYCCVDVSSSIKSGARPVWVHCAIDAIIAAPLP
jgi:hypothetical protein